MQTELPVMLTASADHRHRDSPYHGSIPCAGRCGLVCVGVSAHDLCLPALLRQTLFTLQYQMDLSECSIHLRGGITRVRCCSNIDRTDRRKSCCRHWKRWDIFRSFDSDWHCGARTVQTHVPRVSRSHVWRCVCCRSTGTSTLFTLFPSLYYPTRSDCLWNRWAARSPITLLGDGASTSTFLLEESRQWDFWSC